MFYEFKLPFKVRTIPADGVRRLLAVDVVSMSLGVYIHRRVCIDRLLRNHKPGSRTIATKFLYALLQQSHLPRLVTVLGNPKPIQRIRQRIIPLAQGKVLEIGVGPGVNFPHYDPARVTKVLCTRTQPRDDSTRRRAMAPNGTGHRTFGFAR
jgi:hypothetical protein